MFHRPDQAMAAAFFDSHRESGLYDLGFSFPLPGDYINASVFVGWRWITGQESLEAEDMNALTQLVRRRAAASALRL